MKNSAIIFDIDGTAIDSPAAKLPTARLIAAAGKVTKKYYLCPATGRAWSFARPVLKAMKLSEPCIISGGTQICNPTTGEILWECDIAPDNLNSVISIARQFSEQKVLYNDCTEEDYLYGGILPADLRINKPVYMFNFKLVTPEIAQNIVYGLSRINGIVCTKILAQLPGLNDIHVTNAEATKEHAVAELLNMLNIDRKNTIGVGDGHNDLHLFNAVEHKVAVENAVDELKTKADLIIGDVKDDGFAEYLESLSQ